MHATSRALSSRSNAVPAYLSHSDPRYSSEICAKLVTYKRGRKEAILLSLNKPITIGRNPSLCVRSPNGGVIVSCRDLSKNGIVLNDHRIKKTFAILMDGDTIRIPDSLTFTCVHIWKEPVHKANIFDPTPPPHLVQKINLKRIGNYTLTSQCLGTGSFATVHLAIDTAHYCQVACKSIRTRKEHELDQVSKEVTILLDLNHPNINRIYDTRKDGNFIHLFLQLCTGGDLFTYVNSYTEKGVYMCEAEAKYIMYQMLKGLSYLHEKSISHRDLKPENILLHSPGPYPRIQIADFGLARPKSYQATFNVCGTVSYLPPEGILALDQKHLTYVGLPADCWSAGVTLYIMLSYVTCIHNAIPIRYQRYAEFS
ncbi:kinase-like protein [Marasmius fiardii PR-910]|nr:kinase-like protein [Marasmius fiardii PR-910]